MEFNQLKNKLNSLIVAVDDTAYSAVTLNVKHLADGCIAVSNSAMDEIWESVNVGTPIEIKP
jgi:uncharacterized protein with NRDE domain